MRIQPAASYLVSSRLGNHSLAEACHHRAYQHNRTTQAGAPFQELVAFQIGEIHIGCPETIRVDTLLRYRDTHIPHQLDKVVDVQYVRYVVHRHLFRGKQRGADNLQHLVLRSLRIDISRKAMSTFYYK